MARVIKTRKDDEQLLHMLELRDIGYSSAQVGRHVGISASAVRTATNRVAYGSTTPFERGEMDSYYRRQPMPHKIVGTDKITDLTRDELVEYWKGYNENDDFKDYG